MANNVLPGMTLGRWITLAIVAAIVVLAIVALWVGPWGGNRSFEPAPTPRAGGGIELQGSTITENNLDAVRERMQGGTQGADNVE